MMNNIARTRMRELLEGNECVTCASVFDPLSSRMAESIGFDVGILGGSIASLISLGAPDINLLTLNELALQARRVCFASNLPIIVDGDNGYGNSLNVMRAVEELEHIGAAAITIEDTVLPRPFNKPELSLASIDEAMSKLKAAIKARKDSAFSIFARTHALGHQPIDELLARVKAYSLVGIDGICIFGLSDKLRLELISETTHLPIMLITYGDVSLGSEDELATKNVRIRLKGHDSYQESVRATYESLMKAYWGEYGPALPESGQDLINKYSQHSKYTELSSSFVMPAHSA
jgi:carboxyvinyl-carboxyphosphonate phosphorylmutase